VRHFHPTSRHHYGDEREHLNNPRQAQQPLQHLLFVHTGGFFNKQHAERNAILLLRCQPKMMYRRRVIVKLNKLGGLYAEVGISNG
jgi:hypothetical protein